LALIKQCGLTPSTHIVDVGGGGSTLVDDLLGLDFVNVTVIDLSLGSRFLCPAATFSTA
jgi:hypothetical protein